MHHLVRVVLNTFLVPGHPQNERTVAYDFHGNRELLLRLTITRVHLEEPRGFAFWKVSIFPMLLPK